MNNKRALSALLTAMTTLSIAASMAAATDDGGCLMDSTPEVRFTNDPLSNRIDDLLAEDDPIFIFFYSDRCPYCHQQMPIIDQLEGEYAGEVTFIWINVTERPDHAAEFDVRALPTMVAISGKNDAGEYAREEISGFRELTELRGILAPGAGDEPDGVGVTALAAKCNSCSDCTKKLNGEYDTVVLTTDLINVEGSCIIFGADNIVFDGGGHKIDGDDKGEFESGIAMTSKSGNTIRNCEIADFESGITLYGSSKNEIYDNKISSNYYDGIWISEESNSNSIYSNWIEDNGKYGVFFSSNSNENIFSENVACSNPTDIHDEDKNSGDENTCDTAYNWNDDGVRRCTHSCCVVPTDDLYINSDTTLCPWVYNIPDAGATGVIIIGADDVVLDCNGATINGRDSGRGIYNPGFEDVVLKNCEVSNYQYGIFLSYYSNGNQLIGNTVTSCSGSGFYLQTSSGVKLTDNIAVSNRQGINLYNSSNNELTGNVAYSNEYGFYLGGGTYFEGNTVNQNTACDNTEYDFYVIGDFGGGDDNTCDTTSNWNDEGGRGCTYPCVGGCVVPTDDLYINSDTTLCPGFYDIPDAGAPGVIIIGADDVVLDCNSAVINGSGSGFGIYNNGHDGVTIKNCGVANYDRGGIYVQYAQNNSITNNSVWSNWAGIFLTSSDGSTIAGNNASDNYYGIRLRSSSANMISDNVACHSRYYGIYLWDSSNFNVISDNTANSNTYHGISLSSSSSSNDITGNTAKNNQIGLHLNSTATDNAINHNTFCNSSMYDIQDEDTNSGDENTCSLTDNWDDLGTTGCTHTCAPVGGVCYDYTTSSWMTPNSTTDWNVTHVIVCNDTVVTLNGDLNIDSGGKLGFNNVTLRMNATKTDEYSIEVNSGGAFHINSRDGSASNITNGDNASAYYTFHVNSGSNFTMRNSELHNCGYDWKELPNRDAGLWINTDNTILANNTITNNYYVGAFFYQSDNHTVVNNIVNSNRWYGIRLISAGGSRIIGNAIESTIDGITLSQSPDAEILDNTVSSSHDGIVVSHSPDVTIADNTASSNGNHGIVVASSPDCRILDNTANSNNNGIVVSSSTNATITGNTADSNRDDGIYLSNSPDSVVMDNIANLNNIAVDIGTGIVILSSSHTQVERNVVNRNWRGMFIDSSSGCIISENNASENRWYGIHLNSSRANNLTGNALYSNKGQWDSVGMHLSESEDNHIIDNYATANLHGMVLYKSPNSEITGNMVDHNGGDGIALKHSGHSQITANAVTSNDGGILLESSDDVNITDNNATDNGVGISLHGSNNVRIHQNNASDNGNTGISLSGSGDNQIIDNVAEWNRYGIALTSSSNNNGIRNNTAGFNNFGVSLRWSSNNNDVTDNDVGSSIDYGAYLFRVSNNTILHNNFSNSGSVGVYLEHSSRNTVMDNDAGSAVNYGIDLFESELNAIEANNVRYSGDIGVGLSSSSNNMVAGNVAEGSGTGVSIRFSDDNTVVENDACSNDIGIYMQNSDSNTITGNNVSLSNNVGIDLSLSDGNEIFSNDANGNPNYGIHLYSSASNVLDENNVTSNGVGVYLDWSDGNLISANTVDDNDLTGIALYWSSNNNELVGNEVNSNGNISIRISSSDNNTVVNNTALYNGIGIFLDWSEGNMIAENRADFNRYHGISLDWFSDCNQIINNSASGNIVGIALSWSGNNTVEENVANFNNMSILLEWSSSNNELTCNTANHNEYNGISLHWSSNDNEITGNTANDNRIGLYFDSNSTGNVVTDNTFCDNSLYDIHDEDANSGDENACDSTLNWNDNGTIGCTYACGTEPSPTPDGDLNGDGQVTSVDAAITLRVAAGSCPCDATTLAAADVSGDGRINSLDALMILQAAAGAIEL